MKISDTSTVATLMGLAALLCASCGSGPEFPEAPPPTATIAQPPPTVSAPPPPAPQIGCDAVQSASFSSIFVGRSPTEAAKMELEGGPVCGSVPEGGSVSGPTFFLQPGMTYTVLANGLPNVTEVDVQLVVDATAVGVPPALAALAAAPLAVDSSTGAMASTTYKWPWPWPGAVKVVVKARTGAGAIGAQVYRKKG